MVLKDLNMSARVRTGSFRRPDSSEVVDDMLSLEASVLGSLDVVKLVR